MNINDVFTLLGGIALFLFGMTMMSDGLERVAGSKMRQILETLTKNRLVGTVVGIIITAIIQSSSAVTATVVSFVNAGLMNLYQAVGVIFGANIGTSVTGQLIAFNFDDFAPLIIAVSVVCYMFVKNDLVNKIAYVILGFGILFLGMGTMKDAMSDLAASDVVSNMIQSADNPFLLVLIGLVFTAVIQSNSAVTGILIGMAASGLISISMSFFIILGSNIGATVTALIASVNGNRNAKRAALIHLFFNVIGTVILFVLLILFEDPITDFILLLSPGDTAGTVAARAVAMSNTVFRIFNVIIMFPFANGLVKLTRIVLPVRDHSKDVEDYTRLKYVGENTLNSPTTVLVETAKDIDRLGGLALINTQRAMESVLHGGERDMSKISEYEGYIDLLTERLQEHMIRVTQMKVPINEEKKIAAFFHVLIDIERIGDHAENLAEFGQKMEADGIVFSEPAMEELNELCRLVLRNVADSLEIFRTNDTDHLLEFSIREEQIDRLAADAESNHVTRMTQGICDAKSGIYTDILGNLERMGDHANNIAFALAPQGLEDQIAMELERRAREARAMNA